MTIFYAEDDHVEVMLFCEALNTIDKAIKCITAANGEDALTMLEKIETPSYIFLDLNMPKLNGIECLRRLKQHPRLKFVPVIIYSSLVNEKDLADLSKLGAHKVINKNANIIQLCEDLKGVLFKGAMR